MEIPKKKKKTEGLHKEEENEGPIKQGIQDRHQEKIIVKYMYVSIRVCA